VRVSGPMSPRAAARSAGDMTRSDLVDLEGVLSLPATGNDAARPSRACGAGKRIH